jgi:hypothetical protein
VDDAVDVVRAQPAAVATVAACFVVPLQLVATWVAVGPLAGAGLVARVRDPSATAPLAVLAGLVALPFVSGAMTEVLAADRAGVPVAAGRAVRAALRRWWSLLAGWVLGLLLVACSGLVPFVGTVLALPWVVLAAPVAVAERRGPLASLGRARRLLPGRWWPAAGALALLGATAYVLANAVVLVAVGISEASGAERGLWVAATATAAAVAALATAVVGAGAALLYLDLRVRREGLDLLLEADVVLA